MVFGAIAEGSIRPKSWTSLSIVAVENMLNRMVAVLDGEPAVVMHVAGASDQRSAEELFGPTAHAGDGTIHHDCDGVAFIVDEHARTFDLDADNNPIGMGGVETRQGRI
jgi:hypothetical protein